MIIIQSIPLNIINKCFIIENSNHILFIHLENEHYYKIKSIDKSKIGYSLLLI